MSQEEQKTLDVTKLTKTQKLELLSFEELEAKKQKQLRKLKNAVENNEGEEVQLEIEAKLKKIEKVIKKKKAASEDIPETACTIVDIAEPIEEFIDESIKEPIEELMEELIEEEPDCPDEEEIDSGLEQSMESEPSYRLTSFVGLERSDLAYWYANFLAKLGKKVLMVDNSTSQDLFNPIPKLDNATFITKGAISFIRDIEYSPALFEQYDNVICYLGMETNETLLRKSAAVYVMTDFTPQMLEQIKQLDYLDQSAVSMVFRDKVSTKVSEEMLKKHLPFAINQIYALPYDADDYRLYLNFLYNSSQKFKKASDEMKETLTSMIERATGLAEKNIRKILK